MNHRVGTAVDRIKSTRYWLGMDEGVVAATAFVAISAVALLHVVVGGLLFMRARRLSKRRRSLRTLQFVPLIALVLPCVGLLMMVLSLIGAFADVADVEAVLRATVLAQAISESTNAMAVSAAVAWVLYAITAAIVIVMGFRIKASKRASHRPPT